VDSQSFGLFVVELTLTAKSPISFGEHEAANRIRGMWGKSLYGGEMYSRLFAPSRRDAGPSGLKDPPRPYVLRTRALDGRSFAAGEAIPFRAHVFDRSLVGEESVAVTLDLAAQQKVVSRVQVEFLTPTELKGGEGAEFAVLFARLRDRLSSLRALYGDGPLDIDFVGMAKRARAVRVIESELTMVDRDRVSRRTGEMHSIGGFMGRVIYEGELSEFLPYLAAGEWTGVGRQTVWGKGEIQTMCLNSG